MPTLVFVRHAKTNYNKTKTFTGRIDCDITEEGFEKAKEKFKDMDKNFDYIYCSPLKRTKQTLDAIIPNTNPIIDERIVEIYLGDWQGVFKETLDKDLIDAYRAGLYTPPNAESTQELDDRVCSFVEDMFKKYSENDKILIVTHSGVMRAIKRNFVEDYEAIKVKNLEVVTLTKKDYDYYLRKKEV